MHEIQSTGSLNRGKSRDIDNDAASLFNYMPRGTPGKNAKSILYRMHNKPKKQLNILDGSSQRYLKNSDVQRFNEDFDNQSMKSYATLSSSTKFNQMKPPLQAGVRPRTNP